MAFSLLSVKAQTPFVDTARPNKFVELGVHLGEGVCSVRQNFDREIPNTANMTLTPGNRFDVGLTAAMPIRKFLAIGTGLDFTASNYYWSINMLDRQSGSLEVINSRNHFYCIEIPIYLQFRFNLGNKVSWRNDIGAYLDLGVGGTQKLEDLRSYTNELGQSQVTETSYKQDYFKAEQPAVCGVNDTDWGFRLATGIVAYSHWSVTCVFNAGARNVAMNTGVFNINMHNINLTFKVGYVF